MGAQVVEDCRRFIIFATGTFTMEEDAAKGGGGLRVASYPNGTDNDACGDIREVREAIATDSSEQSTGLQRPTEKALKNPAHKIALDGLELRWLGTS